MKTYKHNFWNRLYLILLLVSCCSIVQAQNTLILNGGITVLNGGAAGTPVYLVVNESNPAGITRLSGHIHSENQYNFVKWISGTGTGNYIFPFGVAGNAADFIPFTFNKTTAGSSNIDMATWATNVQNAPHAAATNVGAVTSMTGVTDSVLYALDRFWDIQTSAAVTADLTFSYLGLENTTSNPTDTVKAHHWNGSTWDTPVGPGNLGVVAGVGTAGPFVGQSTFSPWILAIIPTCPTAVFSYPTNYCDNDATTYSPTFAGGLGGTYSATPVGLDLDTLTGDIIPANSTPGTYTITYTIDSTITCPEFTFDTTITINSTNSIPQNQAICQGDSILLGGAYQNTSGVFIDTLSNINGCDSVITTTLTVNPAPIISQNAAICIGDSLLLGGAYQTTSGVYNDTLTSTGGCDSIIATTLTVNTSILSPQNQSICQGDSILLGGFYQIASGVYNDTLTAAAGCDSVLVTTLFVVPVVTTPATAAICQGDSVLLGGFMQTTAGIYYDTLQSSLSCDSILATTLTVNPLPTIVADTSTSICNGSSANLTASGGVSYVWDNGLGAGQNQSVSPTNTTTYVVTGTDVNGCSDTSSVVITVITPTVASAGLDQELCEGVLIFTLNGNAPLLPGETGIWSTTSSATINTPTTPNSTGSGLSLGSNIFTWTIINPTCPTIPDNITIIIESCEPSVLIIPNVFTPNDDGSNDVFTVEGTNLVSVDCVIFNRWGQRLYSWDNINGSWDGRTTSGSECPDGTYFYLINALGLDGVEYFKKGTFSLIR